MPPAGDFATGHLNGEARLLADAIVAFLTKDLGQPPYGGGCRAFYSPEEWKARGEEFGTRSVLVLAHDGGDMAVYCNPDYEDVEAVDRFWKFLEGCGYWIELCTCWYTAVYRT